ncbi:hypothetical protein LOD99_11443 [Oopsacas minuta]|uniref:MULE transposase domain-containing protein n=1 Tax=Oopsacas minuta TaxID=111878 RepID=A0AAV7K3W9_9METZ|nr:hypothetical protein LOD99_11443 [Oopsacas minuta]
MIQLVISETIDESAIFTSRTYRHIVEMFRKLRPKAGTDALVELTNYVYTTWIPNCIWTPYSWSVYNQLIRTNNDVEDWHSKLNRAATRNSLHFIYWKNYYQEAKMVDL